MPAALTEPIPTCREVIDFLMAYMDGELPPNQRFAFERHLSVCPSCVQYLTNYKTALRLSRESAGGMEQTPPGLPEGLVRAIRDARKSIEDDGSREP